MSFGQYVNLDFDQIKTSIKNYRNRIQFYDYDFEGSNLSIIIDVSTYNTYITSYNTNMGKWVFSDSSTLRENVVALARNIGYVPRSRRSSRAKISFFISGITETVTHNSCGIICNGVHQIQVYFSIPEDITVPVSNGVAIFNNIEIYEDLILKILQLYCTTNQRYVLANSSIDTSTIRVKVKPSESSSSLLHINK